MGVTRTLVLALLGVSLGACGAPQAAPAVVTTVEHRPGSVPVGTSPPPSPVPSPTPQPVDADPLDPASVPGCEEGCEVRFDLPLPDGGRFAGVQGAGPDGFPRGLLVERTAAGEVRTAEPVEAAYVTTAVCGPERCVAVFEVGAHGTNAVVVQPGPYGIEVTGRAVAGTPDAVPVDLDGDDRVDVALRESTGEPSYAAAPRFWQTFRQTDDGALERTGCGGTVDGPEDPPTALLTGSCLDA